jgi:hypothetical protein
MVNSQGASAPGTRAENEKTFIEPQRGDGTSGMAMASVAPLGLKYHFYSHASPPGAHAPGY